MIDSAKKRGKIIRHLEEGIAMADDIGDSSTAKRALDEGRSR
jgi:hypothetical protein